MDCSKFTHFSQTTTLPYQRLSSKFYFLEFVEMAALVSSVKAHKFASYFKNKEKKASKSVSDAPSTIEDSTSSTLHKDSEKTTLKQSGQINYKKWENLQKSILDEEQLEIKAKEEEQTRQKLLSTCSHDHSKERQLYEKTTSEKLEASDRVRLKGNDAYKQRNYGQAAVYYREALVFLDYAFPDNEHETKEYNRVQLACLLNLAACKIHQKNFEEVINFCTQALRIDSNNCKALYRLGCAYLDLDKWDEAEKYLLKAQSVDSTISSIQAQLNLLNTKKKVYYKRRSIVCSRMFNHSAGDSYQNETIEADVVGSATVSSSTPKKVADSKIEEVIPTKFDADLLRSSEGEVVLDSSEAATYITAVESAPREKLADNFIPQIVEGKAVHNHVSHMSAEASRKVNTDSMQLENCNEASSTGTLAFKEPQQNNKNTSTSIKNPETNICRRITALSSKRCEEGNFSAPRLPFGNESTAILQSKLEALNNEIAPGKFEIPAISFPITGVFLIVLGILLVVAITRMV